MPQLNPEFFVSQLFWLVVTFSFLLVFLWKISLPRIEVVLKKRERKINDDLATAKELQEKAEIIQKKIDDQLKDSRYETIDLLKKTSINLQQKTTSEIGKLDKELDKKVHESTKIIEKNKHDSLNKIHYQIYEITNLVLSKITNFQVKSDEIKEAVNSVEKKIN